MPAATSDADSQVKFLISCIAHSHNGTPDFGKVAESLGINKPAASMRYSRLLKAHGYNRDGTVATDEPKSPTKAKAPRTPKTPKTPKVNGGVACADGESPSKKRKTLSADSHVKVERQEDSADTEAGDDADGEI